MCCLLMIGPEHSRDCALANLQARPRLHSGSRAAPVLKTWVCRLFDDLLSPPFLILYFFVLIHPPSPIQPLKRPSKGEPVLLSLSFFFFFSSQRYIQLRTHCIIHRQPARLLFTSLVCINIATESRPTPSRPVKATVNRLFFSFKPHNSLP